MKFDTRLPNAVGVALCRFVLACLALVMLPLPLAHADFNQPWREKKYPLILDAYEYNPLDWEKIVKDKRIVGFIGKASDGLSAEYCPQFGTLCGVKWRRYAIAKELYHTRRTLAKALGLKWGSYHLGRAGNPEMQAFHYLQFAQPTPDEVIVLDIESLDDSKFMSLSEAERFARYINKRLGRYPMLYTNHSTAVHIAANRDKYPLLSRMKLWYARYKGDIRGAFPMGNWDSYTIWQFAYGGNCNKRSCPYRVPGTPYDIDVNVAPMTIAELRAAWPFDGLHEEKPRDRDEREQILMANTVVDPEEEKHSDFVIDPDYNPIRVLPGTDLTNPQPSAMRLVPSRTNKTDDADLISTSATDTEEQAKAAEIDCDALDSDELDSDALAAC